MEATDTSRRWWCCRCQAMVLGAGVEAFAGELGAQGDDEVDGGLG